MVLNDFWSGFFSRYKNAVPVNPDQNYSMTVSELNDDDVDDDVVLQQMQRLVHVTPPDVLQQLLHQQNLLMSCHVCQSVARCDFLCSVI